MCYVEQRFKALAESRLDGEKLKSQWNCDKAEYTSRTDTTVFDFQHFSLHDKSHSIRILQNIELLLGRPRIDLLGVGDLWLLLQTAYFHDIGMSMTGEEMDSLWERDFDFHRFLEEHLNEGRDGNNDELYDAITYYKKVDEILTQKGDFETAWRSEDPAELGPGWPIQLVRNVQYIVTDYIRRKHGARGKDNFLDRVYHADRANALERRLYDLVGEISALHTEDFGKIAERLPFEEVAMGDEHIHPRFVAAMLRIGDLLDMDNNRFNPRVLEHRGSLPPKSVLHLQKHKALKHFEITETLIYARAYSDDFETCLETRKWYNGIESEVGALIQNWNQLAPGELKGCLLSACDVKVYLKGNLFTMKDLNHFNFDSRKMQKLLIGDNIYDCRLDCLREYVQNAIDATKVELWNELKRRDVNCPIRRERPFEELLPCDVKEEAFLRRPVEVILSYDKSEKGSPGIVGDKICIKIKDHGIGMDKECVASMTTIGTGWRKRKEYQDIFQLAPRWLQPTGGFGIGIQSAFMVTDEVVYETRTERESTGHRVRLTSPEKSGNVTRENCNYDGTHGTTVTFAVDVMRFMNCEDLGLSKDFLGRVHSAMAGDAEFSLVDLNTFSQEAALSWAVAVCREYLKEQIPNAIFPICIRKKGSKAMEWIASPNLYVRKRDGKVEFPMQMLEFEEYSPTDTGEEGGRCFYHIDLGTEGAVKGSRIVIWDAEYMDCVALVFPEAGLAVDGDLAIGEGHGGKTRIALAFKNIAVPKEETYVSCCRMFLDIMGERAETCLQVSRSKLTSDFGEKLDKRIQKYLRFGLERLIPAYVDAAKARQAEQEEAQRGTGGELTVDTEDIVAKPDLVRMIFCALAYLPMDENSEWRKSLGQVRKFNQEMLDNICRLRVVREKQTNGKRGEQRTQDQATAQKGSETKDEAMPMQQNMVEHCIAKILRSKTDAEATVFFCTDDARYLDIHQADLGANKKDIQIGELIQALEDLLRSADLGVGREVSYKQQQTSRNVVYQYLLQKQEPIFNAAWGSTVLESGIDRWKGYKKVQLERQVIASQDKKPSYFIAPLTAYFQGKAAVAAEKESHGRISYNDEEKYRKYPVAVTRVPFQAALPKGKWAMISPLDSFLESELVKLKNTIQTDERVAIEEILSKRESFGGLVDWTYRFQLPVDGKKKYARDAIKTAYVEWVLNYYWGKGRN